MFKARRDELLEIATYRANNQLTKNLQLQTVEVWAYQGVAPLESSFSHIAIGDDQVQTWLNEEGEFACPDPPSNGAILDGRIRLLFCERTDYRPPGFRISKTSFLSIEQAFHLPSSTLESIFSYQGIHSVHTSDSNDKRIGITIKVPQKMPIANYALSLSFNPETKTTTALIHGAFLHDVLPTMRNPIWKRPLDRTAQARHLDYSILRLPDDPLEITQSSQIIAHIKSCIHLANDPLLLPVLLVYNYRVRAHIFAWDLDDQVVALERQTGVVFAGRTVMRKEVGVGVESIPREKVRGLTRDMHTLMTEIIFFERSVEWIGDVYAWLETLDFGAEGEMMEMVRYMRADAKSLVGYQRALKERVQSQINVLYSYIAQIDNSINAKIEASSARDSSAMKTLALISTVFLPGTYVATLFSMSMFSWSSSSSSSSSDPTVSSKFYIYWAVTIPLTLLTMTIWRIWWIWQEKAYEKEVSQATGQDEKEESDLFEVEADGRRCSNDQ